jgi:NADP-dependent 3-hydroxy acid dehydrogenase YdfG
VAGIALAQAGAKIIATGRRKPELDTLAKQCGGGAIETIVGDLTDARFVDDLVNRAVTSISWSTTPAS